MDWNDLRPFLAVARQGSLTEAARLLRVSPSTVARRLTALEQALNRPLFIRHASGYRLTAQGRALLPAAERAEAALLTLERDGAPGPGPLTGTVRLATTDFLAMRWIFPALPAWRRRYPGIELEVITAVRSIGLSQREADLALRLSRPQQGDLTIRRVGRIDFQVYAAAAYLAGAGLAATPDQPRPDLSQLDWIGWDVDQAWLPAARRTEILAAGRTPVLKTNSMPLQWAAVRAGVGIALLPDAVAAPELVPLTGPEPAFSLDVWLIQHRDRFVNPSHRAVAAFLTGLFRPAAGTGAPPAAKPVPPEEDVPTPPER